MTRATLLLSAIFFVAQAFAKSSPNLYPCDGPQMPVFVDKAQVAYGARPLLGCTYSLNGMAAMQKVPGGYFLVDPILDGHDEGEQFVFLKTAAHYRPQQIIGGFAVFTGTRAYVAQDGFTRPVFAFRAYP